MRRMQGKGTHVGGCLCGAVRYRAGEPVDAGYCHCRLCQRSSGAPVLAWVSFPGEAFAYEKGAPATYRSSENGRRDFCRDCGTQIAFRDARTDERIDVNMATLDDPGSIRPEYHTWIGSRIPWFEIADDLPRYEDDGPDWSAG